MLNGLIESQTNLLWNVITVRGWTRQAATEQSRRVEATAQLSLARREMEGVKQSEKIAKGTVIRIEAHAAAQVQVCGRTLPLVLCCCHCAEGRRREEDRPGAQLSGQRAWVCRGADYRAM